MDASISTQKEDHPPTAAKPDTPLIPYAAGLNAHNQLLYNGGSNIRSFTPVPTSDQDEHHARVLFTCWSSITLITGDRLLGLGHQHFDIRLDSGLPDTLQDGFGDHNGLIGCLDVTGKLYLLSFNMDELVVQSQAEQSPRLGHIALAGNDEVAITFKQAPNGRLCHILRFNNCDDFLIWFQDPSGVKIDAATQHFMMQGRPIQLVAGTATFMVLMEDGEVYSWGDPRYQSLGRSIQDVPAEKPGLVEALGGLQIAKVVCGGWMCAALSMDRALYIWGNGTPGTDRTIKFLRDVGAGEIVLVEIRGENGEPLDIEDVGMGDNHIAVIAERGRLFVVGDNANGQLGLGSGESFLDDWVEVPYEGQTFREVLCGPKATFVFQTGDQTP